MKIKINKTLLELVQGDITDFEGDAIVNAANSQLKLGGGVAGAIRKKGGPKIQKECDKIDYCPVGEARITSAGNLKVKYVVHAVGPVYGEGNEDEKLKNATLNSLKLAESYGVKTIAFPAISTGVFNFPKERCARIMLTTVIKYLEGKTELEKVVFFLYNSEIYKIFENILKKLIKK